MLNNYNIIQKLFQTTDLEFVEYKLEDNVVYLLCEKKKEFIIKCCENCGSVDFKSHGKYRRKIKFRDLFGFQTYIIYNQKRYKCNDCGTTFNDGTSFVPKHCNISTVLSVDIVTSNKQNKTFKIISNDLHVSQTTAYTKFKKHSSSTRNKLSEILLFDEIHYGEKKYAFVIADGITGKIIDILPQRDQDYIYSYFNQISEEEKRNVKFIVTDLFKPYKSVLNSIFYNAKHAVDRFHYTRIVTFAMNKVRTRVMNSYYKYSKNKFGDKYNKYSVLSGVLKKYYRIFLINKYNPEKKNVLDTVIENTAYLKKSMTLQEIIEYCVNLDADLCEAYNLMSEFYKIITESNYDTVTDKLREWVKKVLSSEHNINELKEAAKSIEAWYLEIRNSFIKLDNNVKLSNGKIEGKNSQLKRILKNAAGIKDFDTFRNKVLYIEDPKRAIKLDK